MNFLQAAAAANLNLGNFDFANYSRIFAANNPKVAGEILGSAQTLQITVKIAINKKDKQSSSSGLLMIRGVH